MGKVGCNFFPKYNNNNCTHRCVKILFVAFCQAARVHPRINKTTSTGSVWLIITSPLHDWTVLLMLIGNVQQRGHAANRQKGPKVASHSAGSESRASLKNYPRQNRILDKSQNHSSNGTRKIYCSIIALARCQESDHCIIVARLKKRNLCMIHADYRDAFCCILLYM